MANGELIIQVDELLQQDKISPNAAATLTLKLLKSVYETQQDHSDRLRELERINTVNAAERDRLVDWPYVRDKLVQPVFMILLGVLIAYLTGGG